MATLIRHKIVNIKIQGANFNIFWVKRHTDVSGNEFADKEAKKAAGSSTENYHYNKTVKAQLASKIISVMTRK